MSMFGYNYYKTLKRPYVYLSYPNKKIIGTIVAQELETDFMANSMTKGTFKVYRYLDGIETPNYDWIKIGMYIQLSGIDWFIITELDIVNEDNNEYKEITYISLEHELSKKYLTSFGSMGVETDEQGGLDRYCLYNILDQEHSILHIVVQKNPDWSINYVDPNITTEYRSFEVDSIDTYSFLTGDVSEAFDCIFLFDSTNKTISAYLLENLGQDTNITLSYRNFIKSVDQNSDDDDVKTVLTVVGGNDSRTNTPLGIIDVNISGTNQIYNFTYYLDMMSDELKEKLQEYDVACANNEEEYQQKLLDLGELYVELNELKNRVPDNPDSTNWTEYGSVELEAKEKEYWQLMSVNTNQYDETQVSYYNQYKKIHDAITAELEVRKGEIEDKEAEIESMKNVIQGLVIKLEDFLGIDLYKELNAYIKENTLTDDSFVATTVMTDDEILEMQKSLLEHAKKELSSVCYPKFETTVDLVNFTVDYDYKKFTDQLELFNIIHIRFEEHDVISDARLLKLHVNWDDPTDFSATFSNRNSLDESFGVLKEIQDQANSTATEIGFASGAWSGAAQTNVDFRNYQNSIFDASLQQIQNSDNQELRVDETGILLRKWIPEQSRYDLCQTWFTNAQMVMTLDGWNTVSLALGHIKVGNDYFYGLNAERIVGKFLIGEQLYITNDSGSYSITKDGMIAQNGSYQVKINPDTPSEIFSISIDNEKLLYVDTTNKKLKFEGDIESTSGHIANFTISNNSLISGKIGMCSDTTNNAIAFWAGNTNKSSAPFRVTNNGNLICSNATITGGTLQVGSNFSVNSSGILTATGANISGSVTATSGKIGGWTINGNKLVGTSGNSYIEGGEIDIGDGLFIANDSEVYLGDFCVLYNRRGQFSSLNEMVGMMASASGSQQAWLWAGANDDPYPFVVTGEGKTRIAEIANTRYWEGYSLDEALDYIWSNSDDCGLKDLADRINYLEENVVWE